jgi:hypothetical protein
MVIAQGLNATLPLQFVAEPRVHLGSAFEIDVATYENDQAESWSPSLENGAGIAANWSPGRPEILLETEMPVPSEYEVLVYDASEQRRLVAAIEIVSPSNKDRLENRRAFVHKCATLLNQDVCVAIVDLVTIRTPNLYLELTESIGAANTLGVQGPLYAVACRGLRKGSRWRVEGWGKELALGQPLPILPLWLSEQVSIPLDLETTYEETCRSLRIR